MDLCLIKDLNSIIKLWNYFLGNYALSYRVITDENRL